LLALLFSIFQQGSFSYLKEVKTISINYYRTLALVKSSFKNKKRKSLRYILETVITSFFSKIGFFKKTLLLNCSPSILKPHRLKVLVLTTLNKVLLRQA